jgi:hypothetical protein
VQTNADAAREGGGFLAPNNAPAPPATVTCAAPAVEGVYGRTEHVFEISLGADGEQFARDLKGKRRRLMRSLRWPGSMCQNDLAHLAGREIAGGSAFVEERDPVGADTAVTDELIGRINEQVTEFLFRQCMRLGNADAIHLTIESHSMSSVTGLVRWAGLPDKPSDATSLGMLDDRLSCLVAIAVTLIRQLPAAADLNRRLDPGERDREVLHDLTSSGDIGNSFRGAPGAAPG